MSTTNVVFDKSWKKIVNAGDEFLLTVPVVFRQTVEVAIGEPEAGAAGHEIDSQLTQAMNRALIGPGDVYARRTITADVTGVLTAWTPV